MKLAILSQPFMKLTADGYQYLSILVSDSLRLVRHVIISGVTPSFLNRLACIAQLSEI